KVGLENRFGLFGLRHGGPSCLIKLDVNIRNQEGNSNIKRLTFWDSPLHQASVICSAKSRSTLRKK
ncbi:MAG: hypothetical protein NTW14_14075, partial [bacterium]|nr:hypothetical protein [bacterium]